MASIQERSGSFRVSVCKDLVRETATLGTRKAAREWGKRREIEIPHEIERVKTNFTLAQAIARELPKIEDRREFNILKRLARDLPFANKPISKIAPADLQGWVDQRLESGIKSSTVNRELNVLTRVCPLRAERPKNPPARVRRISAAEIEKVCAVLRSESKTPPLAAGFDALERVRGHDFERRTLATCFLLAIETGMRQGEILGILWEHVDLEARSVHLPKTKNGDARDVALSLKAVELIRSQFMTADQVFYPLTSQKTDHLWRDACRRAGIANLHFHDSRHEACSRLARKLPVQDLARMLGWRDLKSLMRYYHPSTSEIAAKLD